MCACGRGVLGGVVTFPRGGGSLKGSPFCSARRMRSYHCLGIVLSVSAPMSTPLALAACRFSAYLSLSTGSIISILLKAALVGRSVAISVIADVSAGRAAARKPVHCDGERALFDQISLLLGGGCGRQGGWHGRALGRRVVGATRPRGAVR